MENNEQCVVSNSAGNKEEMRPESYNKSDEK